MVDSTQYYPSRFLKGDDVPKDINVKVTDTKVENVGTDEEPDEKIVAFFEGYDRGLVLNKTNKDMMVNLSGSANTDKWINATVGLTTVQVQYMGQIYKVIRIVPPHRAKG